MCCDILEQIKPDTLRYFYSAIFQGFAALISFGIVVFTVYLQKIENNLSLIENSFHTYKQGRGGNSYISFLRDYSSFWDYCQAVLSGNAGHNVEHTELILPIVKRYEKQYKLKAGIQKSIKQPLISSALVLFVSVILLLFVDLIKSIFVPLILFVLVNWALIEIVFTIKFALEFKIFEPKTFKIFKKIMNVFYWK